MFFISKTGDRMRVTRLFELVVFGVICLMVATPVVAGPTEDTPAKCSDGRDNDRDGLIDGDDPDCQQGGGGGDITLPDTEAGWRGAVRDVDPGGMDTTRRCFVESSTPDGSHIHYTCSHATGSPAVVINLTEIDRTQIRKRGDPTLCGFL